MRNYAFFLQSYRIFVHRSEFITSLSIASISQKFLASNNPGSTDIGAGAWLAIVGGILTSLSGFAGPAGPALDAAIGVLGIVGGVLGSSAGAELEDPRFTSFADLQSNFGKLIAEADKASSHYFNSLFSSLPAEGDVEAGTALAKALMSGAFTTEDVALIPQTDTTPALLRTMILAPVISELWNTQKVFIAKIPRGKVFYDTENGGIFPVDDFTFDPCFGGDKHDEILSGRIYCPKGSEQDGFNNYLVVSRLLFSCIYAKSANFANR